MKERDQIKNVYLFATQQLSLHVGRWVQAA